MMLQGLMQMEAHSIVRSQEVLILLFDSEITHPGLMPKLVNFTGSECPDIWLNIISGCVCEGVS